PAVGPALAFWESARERNSRSPSMTGGCRDPRRPAPLPNHPSSEDPSRPGGAVMSGSNAPPYPTPSDWVPVDVSDCRDLRDPSTVGKELRALRRVHRSRKKYPFSLLADYLDGKR